MWPAPLNVGHIACRLIAFLFRCCMGTAGSDRSSVGGFRTEMSVADELDSQSREQSALRTCYAKHVAAKHKETAVAKLHEFVAQGNESTHVRLESMQRQIKRLMEVARRAAVRRQSQRNGSAATSGCGGRRREPRAELVMRAASSARRAEMRRVWPRQGRTDGEWHGTTSCDEPRAHSEARSPQRGECGLHTHATWSIPHTA